MDKKNLNVSKDTNPADMIMKTYRTVRNPYIRKCLPENTKSYFKNIPIIGIVPKGTKILVLDKPVAIDRKFAVQYWVKMKVLE